MIEYPYRSQNNVRLVVRKDKNWKRKYGKKMECRRALSAQNQENSWYLDSGCSKNMTGDKSKFFFAKRKGQRE